MIEEKQLNRFLLNPGHQTALKHAAISVICFARVYGISEEEAKKLFNLGLDMFIKELRSSVLSVCNDVDKEYYNSDGSLNKEKVAERLKLKK